MGLSGWRKDGAERDRGVSQRDGKVAGPTETGILDSSGIIQDSLHGCNDERKGIPLLIRGPEERTLQYGPLAAASHCHANERG